MAVPIWNENSKHYRIDSKPEAKDRIEVEVGDSQDPSTFHPQMKLMRWDNEANVSFRMADFIPGATITNDEQNGIITWKKKWKGKDWIARFYEDWGTPEGAYKFVELVLPERPPLNSISFSVQSKDVDFFYQPPLTQQEIDEGASRPDEVVGSYAIYSKSSGGMNRVDGKEYKVGKVGHLYRAKIIDANGNETWGDYNADLNETGILTLSVDPTWLDNAVYPVVVDPTFGYTDFGQTQADIAGFYSPDYYSLRRGIVATAPANSKLEGIVAYLKTNDNASYQAMVFLNEKDSGGSGVHGQVAGIEVSGISTTNEWKYFVASDEDISASTDYVFSAVGDSSTLADNGDNIQMAYDATSITYASTTYNSSSSGPSTVYNNEKDDPWSTTTTTGNFSYSIYAIYSTPIGGESIKYFRSVGTTSWTIPAGVSSIDVQAWGAGGGGGDGSNNGGGGGGGGAYAAGTVSVTAGNSHDVVVGQGGARAIANSSSGSSGGDSSFNSTDIVADGGNGGGASSGSSGGLASNSTGTTKYNGGSGGNSNTTSDGGGGGGGAAGPDGVGGTGGNATTTIGGVGGTGDNGSGGAGGTAGNGGHGGDGVTNDNGGGGGGGGDDARAGGNGGWPGGGGGGGESNSSYSYLGNGADGLVIITYTASGGGTAVKDIIGNGIIPFAR